MSVKSLILVVLLLSGCGDVNKTELKALNGYATKAEVNKNDKIFKLVPLVDVVKTEINTSEPKVTSIKELNQTIPVTLIAEKPVKSSDARFKLALKQIQKEKELKEQAKRAFELSVVKVNNEHILNLKSKDIELSKAAVDGKVSMAEIELKKILESEKTKQLIQNQTHSEALLENKNRYEQDKRDALFAKDELEFYKIIAAIVGFLLLLLIFVIYFFKKMGEVNKLKMNENELTHQMQLKMLEHQSQNFDKMLELVSSGKLSENVEKELLGNIRDSQKKTLIFDEKPKKGLIFRR